jgi:hypothetical protein
MAPQGNAKASDMQGLVNFHAPLTGVKERMIETGTYPEFAQDRLQFA